jgi:ribosomal protein S1
VDLGGLEGLVPAREISWERVDDPASVLKSGDMVTVKVLRIDREEGKVSLSRKECLPRVFRRSSEEIAEAKSAEEVAQWMAENEKRNRGFGSLSGAFGSLEV